MMSAFRSLAVSRIFCAGTMTPEIDDLVIVALENDADDVLADVVHVALDRRHHDPPGGLALREPKLLLLLLHEGHEIGDRLLHHARRLHHLRQEHLA